MHVTQKPPIILRGIWYNLVFQGPTQMTRVDGVLLASWGMPCEWIPFWNIADFPWRRFKCGVINTCITNSRLNFNLLGPEVKTCSQPTFDMNRCLGQPPTIAFIQTCSKCFFFEPTVTTYWQNRPDPCFLLWNARLPSISLSFTARHAVMLREVSLIKRCGQHSVCL